MSHLSEVFINWRPWASSFSLTLVRLQSQHLTAYNLIDLIVDLSYVNKVDEKGLTPIFWAASYGQLASLKLLQAHGADVNYKGPFGETALLLASANGHSNIVKELILRGVNVNDVDEVTVAYICTFYFTLSLFLQGWKFCSDVRSLWRSPIMR